ncbi:MAG: hypothetical protein MZV70_76815 [Desulfobacterales bacterium]|nr:hypothetical protein [Desulfobacterales bacterium]
MIIQGNVLIGQGVNASKQFLEVLVPLGESFAPHNVYLEAAYNFGIIGLIAFLGIFLLILFKGISIFFDFSLPNNQNRLIGATLIIIALITIIQNFVSNAFYDRAGI